MDDDYGDFYGDEDYGEQNDDQGGDGGDGGNALFCPNCGSREIEQQIASGASVCMQCGVVVEENAIVSSVQFEEGAGGASSMVGQFVSATSSKAYTGGGSRGGRFGFSRESRETTLANGRRKIQEVASRMRLGPQYVDGAHRLFTIAVEKFFTLGRRTLHVVAACLYITCRQEKSQHMLIDFSDALQVNVYTLGAIFLKFRRLLGLKLEIVDPALYIYRFAAHLDLDEKANEVAMTALRLAARMKRDWIVSGRRPAGICAASLLIAARAHGFDRHEHDVTKILKVCGMTVSTRVREFELTPAANMSLEEFHNKGEELETECDPPAYTRNQINEARARAIQEGNTALLQSGQLDNPMLGEYGGRWRQQDRKPGKKAAAMDDMYISLEHELKNQITNGTAGGASAEPGAAQQNENQLVLRSGYPDDPPLLAASWKKAYPRNSGGKLITLPDQATKEEMEAPIAPVEAKLSLNEFKEGMPDNLAMNVEDFFLSEEEEVQKAAIFNKLHKDYFELQEKREILKKENGETGKRKRGRKKKGEEGTDGLTTEEQLRAAVANKKVSRKINYDALSSIFGEDGSLGNVDEGEGNGGEFDVF